MFQHSIRMPAQRPTLAVAANPRVTRGGHLVESSLWS